MTLPAKKVPPAPASVGMRRSPITHKPQPAQDPHRKLPTGRPVHFDFENDGQDDEGHDPQDYSDPQHDLFDDHDEEGGAELESDGPGPSEEESGETDARDEVEDLNDLVKDELSRGGVVPLREMWIKKEPSTIFFLGTKFERVKVHFNDLAGALPKGYFLCRLDGCPVCHHVKPPTESLLFPVLSLLDGEVYTLQVPVPTTGRQEAHDLFSQVKRLTCEGKLNTMAMIVSKDGSKVTMVPRKFNAEASGGLPGVKAFGKAYAARKLKLRYTFKEYTSAELAQLPAVRTGIQMQALLNDESDEGDAG
jgi:hypothetical protein